MALYLYFGCFHDPGSFAESVVASIDASYAAKSD